MELLDMGGGVCLYCGMTGAPAELDARGIRCEDCGKDALYGIEEAVLSGRLEIRQCLVKPR
jgi:hypothetical protein